VEPAITVLRLLLHLHLRHRGLAEDHRLRRHLAPGILPERAVECHGHDRCLLRRHLVHDGHDVRLEHFLHTFLLIRCLAVEWSGGDDCDGRGGEFACDLSSSRQHRAAHGWYGTQI